jgi:hypothetical protein
LLFTEALEDTMIFVQILPQYSVSLLYNNSPAEL